MKKSKIKSLIKYNMKTYYSGGYTNTALKVIRELFTALDKLYATEKRK